MRRLRAMRCAHVPYARSAQHQLRPEGSVLPAGQQAVERHPFVLMNTEGRDCGGRCLPPRNCRASTNWIIGELQRVEAESKGLHRVPARQRGQCHLLVSCGTSTATGTSKLAKVQLARGNDASSAARGARWCACSKRDCGWRIRSSRSSPRELGRRSRSRRPARGRR